MIEVKGLGENKKAVFNIHHYLSCVLSHPTKQKIIAILTILVFIITVTVFALFYQQIQTVGVIKTTGVKIYSDKNLTQPLTLIDWGLLCPGQNKTQLVFIRNVNNTIIHLEMNTTNWNPPDAANWIVLSWNYNGAQLNINETIPVTFTLSVDYNIVGITDFSFDIIVEVIE